MPRTFVVLSFWWLLVGCNGPKGSPERTVKSYYSAINSRDFNTCAEILAQQSLKKFGSPGRAAAYLAASFDGWQDFDIDIVETFPDVRGDRATVKFDCKAKVIGLDAKLHDGQCNDTYTVVKQADGRWYIVLPETQRLRPM